MKRKYFPWRFFVSLLIAVVMSNLVLISIVVGFFSNTQMIADSSKFELLIKAFGLVVLVILVSILIALRFSLPLRTLSLKTIRLANKRLFYQLTDEFDKNSIFNLKTKDLPEIDVYFQQIKDKIKQRSLLLAHGYEESKTIISSIDEAIVSLNKNGEILFFNAAFSSRFMKKDLSQGSDRLALEDIFNVETISDLFLNVINTGVSNKSHLSLRTYLDDSVRIFDISLTPLKDQKTGEIFAVLGIFHDITEMKKAERIRTEFVENASHELRSPLTAAKGHLSLVLEDIEESNVQLNTLNSLIVVERSLLRLSHLVDDMLLLSQLEQGASLTNELIDLQKLTEDVVQKLLPAANEKNIRVFYNIELGINFFGDAIKIEQVLSNLIGNAIKYNFDGGDVNVDWLKTPNSTVLKVKDAGPGIDKKHQGRLFERFYRVDRARSREVGGTGLGLAIVKHIVQAHQGIVEVESELGKGAEFICRFSLKS